MTSPAPSFTYRARVARVVDGDTLDVDVDLGFRVTLRQRVRLDGIDTPELHSPDPAVRTIANDARAALESMLPLAEPVVIESKVPYADDKYGRYLARIFLADGSCANDALVQRGLAQPYAGGTKPVWPIPKPAP